jgi:hypothetical protein
MVLLVLLSSRSVLVTHYVLLVLVVVLQHDAALLQH